MAERTEVIAEVCSVEQIRAVMTARRRELGYTQEELSALADLPDRYVNKQEARMRNLGAFSFLRLMPTLGLRLQVVKVENDDGVAA